MTSYPRHLHWSPTTYADGGGALRGTFQHSQSVAFAYPITFKLRRWWWCTARTISMHSISGLCKSNNFLWTTPMMVVYCAECFDVLNWPMSYSKLDRLGVSIGIVHWCVLYLAYTIVTDNIPVHAISSELIIRIHPCASDQPAHPVIGISLIQPHSHTSSPLLHRHHSSISMLNLNTSPSRMPRIVISLIKSWNYDPYCIYSKGGSHGVCGIAGAPLWSILIDLVWSLPVSMLSGDEFISDSIRVSDDKYSAARSPQSPVYLIMSNKAVNMELNANEGAGKRGFMPKVSHPHSTWYIDWDRWSHLM